VVSAARMKNRGPVAPSRKPRYLVGTFEIAGFCDDLAAGLRANGAEVTTAMCMGQEAFGHIDYDVVVGRAVREVSWPALGRRLGDGKRPPARSKEPLARLYHLIRDHDVFIFVHSSLRHDHQRIPHRFGIGREFPLLARLGKRIVCFLNGPDVRHASAYDQELKLLKIRAAPLGSLVRGWGKEPLSRPLRNLRRIERWAHVIFSQPNQSSLALRPYHHGFAPIDVSAYRPHVPGRAVPVIVHAPSHRATKGTPEILAALERLKRRGVRFELRLVENLSNLDVRAGLEAADVCIDQIHLPLHGKLAVEAMAAGCAVATCDRLRLEPYPAGRPIFPLSTGNIEGPLARLLKDRALRVRLGHEGRAHVEQFHDRVAVAASLLAALGPQAPPPRHHPDFFARHYHLPSEVTIPADIRRLSRAIIRRYGLPEGVEARNLLDRGLL
jgi:hypothetical protein